MAPLGRDNKALNAKHAELLKAMLKTPANKICADCKRNDARWASTNLGVFMCIRCSGVHRGLGVHISRIKSVDLDTWLPEQVANVQKWGNTRANAYWEAHLREGHVVPEHKIEAFIRSKYESRRWAREGPLPDDPSVLDPEGSAPAPVVEATPAASTSSPPASRRAAGSGGIDLLAGPPAASSANAVPRKAAAAAPATTSAGEGLFDLDFSPAATANATAQQQTAVRSNAKADILSLFSAAPPPRPQAQAPSQPSAFDDFGAFGTAPQPQRSSNAFGSFGSAAPAQPTSDPFGSFGSGAASQSSSGRGVSSAFAGMSLGADPWATPAAAPAPQQQQASSTASLYNSADVWGGGGSGGATDAFGGFSSQPTSTAPKAPDAFSNLWG